MRFLWNMLNNVMSLKTAQLFGGVLKSMLTLNEAIIDIKEC